MTGYLLNDDVPKKNPWQQDRLGYKPFCQRLAKVIVNLDVPNGYVIGLHGEWGSGKSTALNFIQAFLEKHNQETEAENDKITLIDFRPWIVSGHQDLIAAFFKVMAEKLDGRQNGLKKRWKGILGFFKRGGDPLVDAAATLALTIDPSFGAASTVATPIAKKSLELMVDRFLEEPSLQTAYEDLKKRLSESKKRFFVTIDDIDRLREEEILSIMQMVKTVGQLPNVIYLLAYDRDIVWHALDGTKERRRPHFGEKIVQQEIELPSPSKDELLTILDSEIDFLRDTPSDLRWHYIVQHGLRRWVRHARDVVKLANALKLSWSVLQGEIDPQDLCAMEGLRLFDPIAFEWIRWNKDFLFGQGRFRSSHEDERKNAVSIFEDQLEDESKREVFKVLQALFPRKSIYFGGSALSTEETHAYTVSRRGIGCEAGYDAYFGFRPSPDAVPKAVIDSILVNLENRETLHAVIDTYLHSRGRNGQPMVGQLLEEVGYRFQGIGRPQPTQALLDVLFEIGEDVFGLDWNRDGYFIPPAAWIRSLIGILLDSWGPEKAGEHLVEAFERSKSPAFNADVFVGRARELGQITGDPRSPPRVNSTDLITLGRILLPQIEKAGHDGTLSNAPSYTSLLIAWKYLDQNGSKNWVSKGIDASAAFLSKITKVIVAETNSSEGHGYAMETRPDPDLFDLSALLAACQKHLPSDELDNDARERIRVVARAASKMLSAVPPG